MDELDSLGNFIEDPALRRAVGTSCSGREPYPVDRVMSMVLYSFSYCVSFFCCNVSFVYAYSFFISVRV